MNTYLIGKIKSDNFRNSKMTMILRDSIGGNCMTRMIATISAESQNIGKKG